MKKGTIILGVVIVIIAIIIFGSISTYNGLVQLEEKTDSSWAQVENQLKRRADLIPNLVNTVKGFAAQEKDVLLSVTKARSGIEDAKTPQEYAQADQQLTNAIKQLNVVVERYPELKSNENFLNLQTQLEGTENRISVARKDYNDSVQILNARIRNFPTNIVASIFNIEKKQYFQINEADKEVPDVKFD